ncbi:MAG: adenine-specific methyltransferase EcoRI family protein [Bacteroidaceae bacterium]|nr:adenine-specific methyltransferase EcoRI family protein [Bacteroidaceae bacterium]
MAQSDLSDAKKARKDEFYTQYSDIQREMNAYLEYDPKVFKDKTVLLPCDDPEWSNFTKFFAQNFENFELKKLISTSYAVESKLYKEGYQVTMFEESAPHYDSNKTRIKGKIFTLDHDTTGDGKIDVEDLQWNYLKGDGDFRSKEIKKLRDESDIIITNPPFSLFREFLAWIMEANKKFIIIGNMNAITYKEVFPLIKNNQMWTGIRFNQRVNGKNMTFYVPDNYNLSGTEVEVNNGKKMISVAGIGWYTNIDHGRRHQPLKLMTMADNLKFNKKLKSKESYDKYDNYDAIEVPFTECIPSDYEDVMGVPISFLNKYNPEQFEILGATQRGCHDNVPDTKKYNDYWEMKQNGERTGSSGGKTNENANLLGNDGKKNYFINKEDRIIQSAYQRLFIKHRR